MTCLKRALAKMWTQISCLALMHLAITVVHVALYVLIGYTLFWRFIAFFWGFRVLFKVVITTSFKFTCTYTCRRPIYQIFLSFWLVPLPTDWVCPAYLSSVSVLADPPLPCGTWPAQQCFWQLPSHDCYSHYVTWAHISCTYIHVVHVCACVTHTM